MTDPQRIALMEDEDMIGKMIVAYLEREGYAVDWYQNGQKGWEALEGTEPDLVILDLMLPDLSGQEICERLRKRGSTVPIIMLTALGDVADRIAGLERGADDYLVKPFSVRELVARIQALLRRVRTHRPGRTEQRLAFTSGDLVMELDLARQVVSINGISKDLTATEFKLLTILAQNPEYPFTREELILKSQGYDYDGFDRTVDAHIKNIRKKLGLQPNQFIVTVYRIGYKFMEGNARHAQNLE